MALPRPELPGLLPAVLLGESVDGAVPPRSGRDWAVDVVAFVLAVGVGLLVFGTAPDREAQPDWLLAADLVLGLALCVALWWRRRFPVQLALASLPLACFSAMSSIAGTILLFTVAVHRRASTTAVLAVLGVPAGMVYAAVRPEDVSWWIAVVITVLVIGAVVAWGMLVRARRQLVVSLRERAERAEAEQLLRVAQARSLERARIAREMHDVLAHRISLVSLHAGGLEFNAGAGADDVARSAAVIRESAHQALQDLRDILGVLRQEPLDEPERPQPTLADLGRLVEASAQAGVAVSIRHELADPGAVPAGVARTAYRIVQEGLTNAAKHAPDAQVTVSLVGSQGSGLAVEVISRRPAGVQQPAAIPGAGQGLVGLAERALLAGGRLEHGRTPAGDFRLAAWLPWPA